MFRQKHDSNACHRCYFHRYAIANLVVIGDYTIDINKQKETKRD